MSNPADTVIEVSSEQLDSMVIGPDGLDLEIWHRVSTSLMDSQDQNNDMTIQFEMYVPKDDKRGDGELMGCAIVLNVTFGSGESRSYLFHQSGIVVKE